MQAFRTKDFNVQWSRVYFDMSIKKNELKHSVIWFLANFQLNIVTNGDMPFLERLDKWNSKTHDLY